MSSGVYAALSGAVARMQTVEVVSNNLSNANTLGYKKDRVQFSAVLDSTVQAQQSGGINYSYVEVAQTDYSQGMLVDTRNDFDVAISGDGYFKVRSDDGELYFTRIGAFDRRADGTLVTRTGEEVLSPANENIVLPDGPFVIDERGRILGNEGVVNELALVDPDTDLLIKRGNGRYSFDGDERVIPAAVNSQLMQGHLEQSNVKSIEETTLMMTSLRAFENYQKAMKNYFTLESKMDDIGSL
nr:flagellar hook basal-body protein [uncultured Desulfuromonas sp.]